MKEPSVHWGFSSWWHVDVPLVWLFGIGMRILLLIAICKALRAGKDR